MPKLHPLIEKAFDFCQSGCLPTWSSGPSSSASTSFLLVANGKNFLELATGEIVCSPSRTQDEDVNILTDVKVSIRLQPEADSDATLGELIYVEPDADEDGSWASWMGFRIGLPANQFEELWTATIARTPPTGFAFGVARDAMK